MATIYSGSIFNKQAVNFQFKLQVYMSSRKRIFRQYFKCFGS